MDLGVAARLARLSALAYERPGVFKRVADAEVTFFSNKDTQAYLVRGRWLLPSPTDLVPTPAALVFRGTQVTSGWSWRDIRTNMELGMAPWETGGQVHEGYAAALRRIWPDVANHLAVLPPETKLYFAGHSLGGALATVASTLYRPGWVETYTFGAPRVGDLAFARRLRHVHRFVHAGDIAPKYPSTFLGYRHPGDTLLVGGEHWHIGRRGRVKWRRRSARIIPFTRWGVTRGVMDHSVSRYVEKLRGAQL